MKNVILAVLLSIPIVAVAQCPVNTATTPNLGLYLPANGSYGWGNCYTANWMTIDTWAGSHGGGSGPTVQTNGTANTTQTILNFVNPSSFAGLTFTFSNPTGGVETFSVGGTLNNNGLTNSSITLGSTTISLGTSVSAATGFNADTANTINTSGTASQYWGMNSGATAQGWQSFSQTYPAAGVANSTGTAWGTSYTVGTGDNDLVQLNGSGALPAISGANLTSLVQTLTAGSPIVVTPTGTSWEVSCPTCGTSSGGTTVTVNGGSNLGTLNLNGTTPAAGSGYTNATVQISGSNASVEVPNLTASQINTLIQGLTGCNTATYVYTPQGADCVLQNVTTTDALTMNNSGSGAASGSTFNGSAAVTLSYNSIGASPLAGSTSLTTLGTITVGTWHGTTIPSAYGGTGVDNSATLTLGTSNQNWATLGTGIVKNTTATGALSNAASADVYGLWTGTCSSSTYLRGDGACAAPGTVTSVALTTPSWLTVSGSPITSSGTLAISGTSETAKFFLAAPNGSAGAMTPRAIVASDVPTLNQTTTGNAATATNLSTNGTAGQVWGMNSGGSAQGWQSGGSGSGTVNSGTAGHIGYYAASGTAISSDSNLDDGSTTANTLTYAGSGGIALTGGGAIGGISPKAGLFSSLAACSTSTVGWAIVTDSTTQTWGATVTGTGTPATPYTTVFCDGSNWTVMGK